MVLVVVVGEGGGVRRSAVKHNESIFRRFRTNRSQQLRQTNRTPARRRTPLPPLSPSLVVIQCVSTISARALTHGSGGSLAYWQGYILRICVCVRARYTKNAVYM